MKFRSKIFPSPSPYFSRSWNTRDKFFVSRYPQVVGPDNKLVTSTRGFFYKYRFSSFLDRSNSMTIISILFDRFSFIPSTIFYPFDNFFDNFPLTSEEYSCIEEIRRDTRTVSSIAISASRPTWHAIHHFQPAHSSITVHHSDSKNNLRVTRT